MKRIGWRVTPAAYLGGGGRCGVARAVVCSTPQDVSAWQATLLRWPAPNPNHVFSLNSFRLLFISSLFSPLRQPLVIARAYNHPEDSNLRRFRPMIDVSRCASFSDFPAHPLVSIPCLTSTSCAASRKSDWQQRCRPGNRKSSGSRRPFRAPNPKSATTTRLQRT